MQDGSIMPSLSLSQNTQDAEACYFCGHNEFEIVIEGSYHHFTNEPVQFRALRCKRCEFVMTDPVPTEQYEENYAPEHEEAEIGVADIYRIRRVESYFGPGARVLDIGCSLGNGVEEALRRGAKESIGVELCRPKAVLGRSLGRDIRSLPLQDCSFEDEYFDVVQAHHTLEHIKNLNGFLAEIKRITKAGGILYVTQPRYNSPLVRDANWPGWFPQQHLWHFSEKTLVHLLSRHGFRLVDYRCILATEYATAVNILYPAKRAYKILMRTLSFGDNIDAVFIKS